MLYQEQQRVLNLLQNGLDNKVSAAADGIMRSPVSDFTCKELLAKEKEVFFKQTPLLMGLSTDLPEPDSYVATSETGVPILLTRDANNKFRAFLNVCRHRGVQLIEDGRGKKNRFSCPFHGWTYKNAGNLIAITHEEKFGCLNKEENGLVELPSQEAFGMLWVRPSVGESFDIEEVLGGLAPEMESWELPRHAFTETQVLHADINWKLAIDTFGENYHFDILHSDTLGPEIHGNLQTHDIYGENYRMVFAHKPGFAYVHNNKMPIEQWPYRWITLNVYFLYPNTIFLVDPAGVDVLRMYPDPKEPSKSRTYHSYYMNPDIPDSMKQFNEDGTVESRFTGFNRIIVDEDFAAATSTQQNALSGAQTHYLFGQNEPALHHYHNAHRRGLGLPELKV
ncbi:MAG: aromatic ring-hydroxylating dioxygenase subunit alpha, partial [Pseudomonadota bacterium]